MLTKILQWWQGTRASFWFVPASIVLGAVGLACALISLDRSLAWQVGDGWSPLFGAGAAGSRGLLTAVATSMITVAGVVFSITIVALSLTSSQYTSRILVNFMGDRLNQVVLGVFVGTFAYCLVVLRTIRGGDEGAFVPSLAVLMGLLLAFVAIGFLIYFIHYISLSIQASSVIAAAAQETIVAVDGLFPDDLGDAATDDDPSPPELAADHVWLPLLSPKTGYIESVDGERLLALALGHEVVVRMELGVGEFVVQNTALASFASERKLEPNEVAALQGVFGIGRHRTVWQDASFGIRQIVDVAMKALSPGVNDTTTAVMCVDYLMAVLVRMGPRRISPAHRIKDGKVCVVARGPSFVLLLTEAFDQIRHNAHGNLAVLLRMLHALRTVAIHTPNYGRRRALLEQAKLTAALARQATSSQRDVDNVAVAIDSLTRELCSDGATF